MEPDGTEDALVEWVNLHEVSQKCRDIFDVSDGIALAEIFVKIHPGSASLLGGIDEKARDETALRPGNLARINGAIQQFLESRVASSTASPQKKTVRDSPRQTQSRISRHLRPHLEIFTFETLNDPTKLSQLVATVLVCAIESPKRVEFLSLIHTHLAPETINLLKQAVVATSGDVTLGDHLDGIALQETTTGEMVTVTQHQQMLTSSTLFVLDEPTDDELSRKDIQTLRHQIREYANIFEDQKKELQAYVEENKFLNGELDRLFEVTVKILSSNAEIRGEKEALVTQLADQQHNVDDFQRQQHQFDLVERECESLKEQYRRTTLQVESLKKSEAQAQRLLEEHRIQLEDSKLQLVEAVKEHKRCQEELDAQENKALSAVSQETKKKIQQLTSENDQLREQHDELVSISEQMQVTIHDQSSVVEELRRYKQRYVELEEEYRRVNVNATNIEDQMEALKEEKAELESNLYKLTNTHQHTSDMLTSLEAEKEVLVLQLEQHKARENGTDSSLDSSQRLQSLESQLAESKTQQLEAIQQENERLVAVNQELTEKLESMELELTESRVRLRHSLRASQGSQEVTHPTVDSEVPQLAFASTPERSGMMTADELQQRTPSTSRHTPWLKSNFSSPPSPSQQPVWQIRDQAFEALRDAYCEQLATKYHISMASLFKRLESYGTVGGDWELLHRLTEDLEKEHDLDDENNFAVSQFVLPPLEDHSISWTTWIALAVLFLAALVLLITNPDDWAVFIRQRVYSGLRPT